MEGCERRVRGRKKCKKVAFLSLFDEKLKIQDKEYLIKATPKLYYISIFRIKFGIHVL